MSTTAERFYAIGSGTYHATSAQNWNMTLTKSQVRLYGSEIAAVSGAVALAVPGYGKVGAVAVRALDTVLGVE